MAKKQAETAYKELTKPKSALSAMALKYSCDEKKLWDVVCKTCIRGKASDEEVIAFLIVANQYGLNPFTREIYAFVGKGGGIIPIVGLDGWAKTVNSNVDFDGCEFEEVDTDDGHMGVSCTMWLKSRRHPVKLTEWMDECKRNTEPWNQMPRRMLRHKAFIQAGRIAFSLAGIYDEDEGRDIQMRELTDDEYTVSKPIQPPQRKAMTSSRKPPRRTAQDEQPFQPPAEPPPHEEPQETQAPDDDWDNKPPQQDDGTISEPQRRRLFAILNGSGVEKDFFRHYLLEEHGLSSTKDIPRELYDEICKWIEEQASAEA